MRKLWIRLTLWSNDVRPKHGPLPYGRRGFGCSTCRHNAWATRKAQAIAKQQALWDLYGDKND